jgi:hypothetical protein
VVLDPDAPTPPSRPFVGQRPVTVTTDAHTVRAFAPCRVCGGAAGPGVGYFGVWRQHPGCASVAASETARLQAAVVALGLGEVSWPDAGLLAVAVPCFEVTHPEPTWEPGEHTMPWCHVDRNALVAALSRLPQLRAEAGLLPVVCTAGRCAWCGCVFSFTWWQHGHVWPDGTPAALCQGCHLVFVRHGEPDPGWWDGQRPGIAEALTGVPAQMGEQPPAGVVGYAEHEREEPDGIDAWCHLDPDAVAAYRWAQWGRFGAKYAPVQHKAEAVARAAARDAKRAERAAEAEASAAERANVYGF